MPKNYRHLKEQDRVFLRIMLEKRYSKDKISKILNVDRSTVYREIKRNSCFHQYSAKKYYDNMFAQKKYLQRRKRGLKLEKDRTFTLRNYVQNKLQLGWSPWQIEGRLKRESEGKCLISHETMYRYIYSDYGIRNRFYSKLRRKHFWRIKHNSRTPRIPKELMIRDSPKTINSRDEFGHWECDLMMFKRGIKSNLITLRERKSRAIIAIKNCLDSNIYFCEPVSPEQKGTIENGNGVIIVELPRGFDIDILKQRNINLIASKINGRPLKCLDYRTPAEIFLEETGFTI